MGRFISGHMVWLATVTENPRFCVTDFVTLSDERKSSLKMCA